MNIGTQTTSSSGRTKKVPARRPFSVARNAAQQIRAATPPAGVAARSHAPAAPKAAGAGANAPQRTQAAHQRGTAAPRGGRPPPARPPRAPLALHAPLANKPAAKATTAMPIARSYSVSANAADPHVEAMRAAGINIHDVNFKNDNPHQFGAAVRAKATCIALAKLYDDGHRNIVDIYGSPRSYNLVNHLNDRLEDPIVLRSFRPIITPKDFTRLNGVVHTTSMDADAFLAVDVYDGFDAQALFSWLEAMAPQMTIEGCNMGLFTAWAGRCFYGDAGECEEALWYRKATDQGPRIYFSQDSETLDPYVHKPLDWMWDDSPFPTRTIVCSDGVVDVTLFWTEWARVASMRIMGFGFTTQPIMQKTGSTFVENLLKIQTPVLQKTALPVVGKYIDSWKSYLYDQVRELSGSMCEYLAPITEQVVLFEPLVDQVVKRFAVEKLRSYNIGRIHRELLNVMSGPTYRNLNRRMPMLTSDLHKTTLALMHNGLEEKVRTAMAYNTSMAAMAAQYNKLHGEGFAVAPPAESSTQPSFGYLKWAGRILAFGYIGYRIYRGIRPVKPGSLIFSQEMLYNCVYAPVVEEVLKHAFPDAKLFGYPLGRVLGAYELGSRLYVNRHLPVVDNLNMHMPAFMMHHLTIQMNLWQAIAFHALFNTSIWYFQRPQDLDSLVRTLISGAPPTAPGMFEQWRELFYYYPWDERVVIPTIRTLAEKYDSKLALIPRSLEPYAEYPKQSCKKLICSGTLPFQRERNPTYFHSMLPTQIPGYVPAVSDYMLACAVKYRITAKPPLSPKKQLRAWRLLWRGVPHFETYPRILWEEEVGHWLGHFDNKKRSKYTDLISRLITEESWEFYKQHALKTSLFMKSNEMLFKFKDDAAQLKPRVIINVHPKVQCLVGPVIWRVQQNMNMEWPMRLSVRQFHYFKDRIPFTYSVSYAGAATDEDLSIWMAQALRQHDHFSVMVSGDDSLIVGNYKGKLYVFEGDASMYDQSESTGPLTVGWMICQRFGANKETIEILSTLAHNTYIVEPKKREDGEYYRINKKKRPLRDTGGADTSVGNSIVMAMAWLFALLVTYSGNFQLADIVEAFTNLGLDMKMKAPSITTCTFLRGMWYSTSSGLYWGPLPSRFLKVGKSLKDPREIYRMKDYTRACKQYLSDVAMSYRVMLSVPLIRRFVEQFAKLPQVKNFSNEYQIQAAISEKPALTPEAWLALEERYGVTEKEWCDAESYIPDEPFVFLVHPVYDALLAADY